jgi:hypothetical protein
MDLPSFTADGLLPVGDYPLTFAELRSSFLVTGLGVASSTWDASWRAELVNNLEVLVGQSWQVGIARVYVDGSFVEERDHPNDVDGYFECDLLYFASRRLHRALNALEPGRIWNWDPNSRRPDRRSGKRQLPMWHRYRVELYPHIPGYPSGIRDQHGHELEFPSAFRISRHGYRPKGIVRMVP